MPVLHFIGYLLPTSWHLSEHPLQVGFLRPSGELTEITVTVGAVDGHLSVRCEVPDELNVQDARNYAEQVARSIAATYAFADRSSFDLRLTGMITEGGTSTFAALFDGLPALRLQRESIRDTAFAEPLLLAALIEFAAAIGRVLETPLHAFRGLELIRRMVAPEAEPREGWRMMNKQLGTSEAYFAPLTTLAQASRHGALRSISEADRRICLATVAEVIERAAHWAAQHHAPLDPATYPRLTQPPVMNEG